MILDNDIVSSFLLLIEKKDHLLWSYSIVLRCPYNAELT